MIPEFIPIRLAVRTEPFDHPDWLYELKLDGFRALAVIESGACRLVSRKAHVYKSFPALCSSLAQLPHEAVLDGEIVCLDRNGCAQFDSLFYHRGEPYYYAFDVPHLDGRDLRNRPLIERKRILRGIVPRSESRLLYLSHIDTRGGDFSVKSAGATWRASLRNGSTVPTCRAIRRAG